VYVRLESLAYLLIEAVSNYASLLSTIFPPAERGHIMLRQANTNAIRERSPQSEQPRSQDSRPQELVDLLNKTAAALDAGHPRRALELLQKSKVKSPWVTNAMAVCLLRLGDAARAVEALKGLVITSGVCFRSDVPAVFLTNFATALLMVDNVSGCESALGTVPDQQDPGVQRLRNAIRKWKGTLSFWQKMRWYWGDSLGCPVELDFPPGDI